MSHVGRYCRGERYMQNHLTNIQNRANCLLKRRLPEMQLTPSYPSIHFLYLLVSTLGLQGFAGACTHCTNISRQWQNRPSMRSQTERTFIIATLWFSLLPLLSALKHLSPPLTVIHRSHCALASTGTHTTQIQAWIFTSQHGGMDKW